MSTRMERLADLPIRTATDFIAYDGEDDTAVVEGEVLDYLLDERDRAKAENALLRSAMVRADEALWQSTRCTNEQRIEASDIISEALPEAKRLRGEA